MNYQNDSDKDLGHNHETDPEEKVGSLKLKIQSHHLLTGNTDTVDQIRSIDLGTPKNNLTPHSQNEKSKFTHYISSDIDSVEDIRDDSSVLESEVRKHTENHKLDLRVTAIMNNMNTS